MLCNPSVLDGNIDLWIHEWIYATFIQFSTSQKAIKYREINKSTVPDQHQTPETLRTSWNRLSHIYTHLILTLTSYHTCGSWLTSYHTCGSWLTSYHTCGSWLTSYHTCRSWLTSYHTCRSWLTSYHTCGSWLTSYPFQKSNKNNNFIQALLSILAWRRQYFHAS